MVEYKSIENWRNFFSERVSGLRVSRNVKLSSRKLSQELNQCESYINKIETGRALPSMEMFFKICEYFDITPAEFFMDTADPLLKSELSELYSAMDSDSRVLFMELAKKLAASDGKKLK
ncbi:MAG: helix-turn-helix domain-containing protein [Ruminococcus sp.]|nr:helix-turn-helix domain-containing protein [Eubacterium sp.]MCM1328112.1 helix-turn-helix domain-containing protein [Ruminococcus sp.]MCM1381844.1 helix-turn-helix domain-containing protein [Muribaculaceae bacterium]MCM1478855.1 helix-turn-helix domain-containing protein [Muribaculaceae bacterium]